MAVTDRSLRRGKAITKSRNIDSVGFVFEHAVSIPLFGVIEVSV